MMVAGVHAPPERLHLTLDLVYAFDRPARHLDLALRVRPFAPGPIFPPIRLASEPEARFEPPVLDRNGVAVDRLRLVGPVSRLRLNASLDHPASPAPDLPAPVPTAADLVLEGLADAAGPMPWPQALGELRESWRYSDDPQHLSQSLPELAQKRAGSCEAIARLAVEIVRARGVPARFVGGYRLAGSQGETRPVRRHAWIAVWEGGRWGSLDPLAPAGSAAGLMATAVGSRLAEVAVVLGSFKSAGAAKLSVSAHAERSIVRAGALGAP